MEQKFFLYARKSTDVEDKQVLSIEAQLTELREFAKCEGLYIQNIFIEKRTAKIPGRPIFNEMLERLEQGEAQGILAWHPDRLARNSVDGGKIIYLLDMGKIQALKFPQFWFEPTSQGKFMLNISFGQSKYYVDSLSENVKRGLRQKVRNGIYPSLAPVGYMNDIRTKTVIVDKKKSGIVRMAFEMYAKGVSRLEDITTFFERNHITSRNGKIFHRKRVAFILSNPFYYGHFKYGKEIYEGKHTPLISKQLFDEVQEVLHGRSRPQYKLKNDPKALCGLFKCGECKMMITAEEKHKKSGKHYTYYRCTKKSKVTSCSQSYIREEELDQQLSELIQKFAVPEDWSEKMFKLLEEDKKDSAQSSAAFVQEASDKIQGLKSRLQTLLSGYLDQDIEPEIYRSEKAKFMSEKKTLEEQIIRIEQKQDNRLEPMREWINSAQTARDIATGSNLKDKKVLARKIFGSNLILETKKARGFAQFPWSLLSEKSSCVKLVPLRGIEPRLPG